MIKTIINRKKTLDKVSELNIVSYVKILNIFGFNRFVLIVNLKILIFLIFLLLIYFEIKALLYHQIKAIW